MPSPRGERCGACLRDAPSFCATIAAMPYVYPIDRVVQGLKYHARLPVAAWVAERLAAAIGDPGDINLVAPIPLGDDRLRERGFNQAWEIARRVARRLERPAIATAITRTRNTTAQTALAFTERRRNLRGAFRANAAVIGQHVALVDDVMTTGATLEEAARTALAGGALSVTCWVVARAYPGR